MASVATGLDILHKADSLLRALEDEPDLSVSELADRTDEPRSSVYRLITSLVGLGWVEPSATRGRYRLGLDMMSFGFAVEDRLSIRTHALPVLERLHLQTGLTAFLCVRRFSRAVCIERVEGRDVRSLATMIGSSIPLFAGAAPRVLLAALPEAEREQILDDGFRLDPNDPAVPPADAIRADIEAVRMQGYAVSDGDVTPGVAAVGAPVRDHRGDVVAAISVSGLRPTLLADAARLAEIVVHGTNEVSASLGCNLRGYPVTYE